MSFSARLDLPNRQVGVLLASNLVEELRNYETDFDQEWRTVTLTSENQKVLNEAEAKLKAMIEQIRCGITTRTEYLHPSCLPLLNGPWGKSAIASIEELYHVKISFTAHNLALDDFTKIIPKNPTALYLVEQFKDLLVPVSPTGEVLALTSAAVWSYRKPDGNFYSFSQMECLALEKLFQYGGQQVQLSDHWCTVDFNEMKVVGTTGQAAALQRNPFLSLPEHRLMVNVKGLELYVSNALSNLKDRLKKDMKLSSIALNGFGRPVSPHSQQQIVNFCRQYCIEFSIDSTAAHHMLHIKGSKEYVDQLSLLLQGFVLRLNNAPQHFPQQPAALPVSPTPHQGKEVPCSWMPQNNRCDIFLVDQNSPEWHERCSRIRSTFAAINILKLERIQNRTVWEKYQLEAMQMHEKNNGMINEKFLFHGTNNNDPYKIARSESGIDFRCSRQDGKLLWGTGAYFAENASYSDHYAHKLSNGKRQIMIVSVLTGVVMDYVSSRKPDLTRPPERSPGCLYDTVKGFAGESNIYVVYDHAKSCPAYIITYTK